MTDAARETVATAGALPSTEPVLDTAPRSQTRAVWDQFRRHKGALIGGGVFLAIALLVIFGPLLFDLDGSRTDVRNRNQGMSWARPFGTDQLGRDMFARMIEGGRISLAVGLTAMGLSLVLGTGIGVLAGYFRRLDGR